MTTGALVALGTEGRPLLDRYLDHVAAGLANLVNLLGTTRIVLHGDLVEGGEEVRAAVEAATQARVLGHLRADVQVTFSALDADAALLGAAGLVLSETFRLAV
jgi:predicted NBD/HSP70 family sugar kinase